MSDHYFVNGQILIGSRRYVRVDRRPGERGAAQGLAFLLDPFALCLTEERATQIVKALNAADTGKEGEGEQ
jgi:hypothetical protein